MTTPLVASAQLRLELSSVAIYGVRTALSCAGNALGRLLFTLGQLENDAARERYCQRLTRAIRLVALALKEVNDGEAELLGAA